MADDLRVNLAIPDPARFEQVLRAAEAVGFRREQAFTILGVATGTVPAARLPALEAVDGVDSVERERGYTKAR